uniref:Clathrin_bdg domain-containing protein n=1 Tax=Strongyloides venezuelensis TaxID=75913 RepID=A0A0K0FND6_STRVS
MENDFAAVETTADNDDCIEKNNDQNGVCNVDDNDDEFGDFADFESAPQPEAPSDPWGEHDTNSTAENFGDFEEFQSPSQIEVINPQINLPSLEELLSDNSIFNEEEEEVNHNDNSDVGVKIYDLLKECDREDIEMSNNNNLYTNIWKDLRIVEETRALGFSLAKSQSYNSFLGALQMNAKKVVPNTLDFLTSLTLSTEVDGKNESQENGTPDVEKSSSQKDIPPASFDWEKSGLENPIIDCNYETSSTDLLDYDSFFNSKEESCSVENPIYSLQNDLYAFGLVSSKNENNDSIETMTNINEILQNVSQKKTGDDVVKGEEDTITYDSLTPEGRTLYNSLPDYSFMLSNVLVFPSKGKG